MKKGGIVEKRGEEETKSMPQVPVTKPPKQKSKTHIKKTHTFKKKKKELTQNTFKLNNDLCISQTYSNDNVKTRLHDTYIVMNKGEMLVLVELSTITA